MQAKRKKKISDNSYYRDSDVYWSIYSLPLIFALLIYIAYPHGNVKGGIVTRVVKTFETETIRMESVHEFSSYRKGVETFWWGCPFGGEGSEHSLRNIVITNKIDSTQTIVENFKNLQEYELKEIVNHEQ